MITRSQIEKDLPFMRELWWDWRKQNASYHKTNDGWQYTVSFVNLKSGKTRKLSMIGKTKRQAYRKLRERYPAYNPHKQLHSSRDLKTKNVKC